MCILKNNSWILNFRLKCKLNNFWSIYQRFCFKNFEKKHGKKFMKKNKNYARQFTNA